MMSEIVLKHIDIDFIGVSYWGCERKTAVDADKTRPKTNGWGAKEMLTVDKAEIR